MPRIAHLPQRGVIAISGTDRVSFLDGLVSNAVARACAGQAIWAALLNAQGRYLHDFFIFAEESVLLLDAPAESVEPLLLKLKRYRLRAAVELSDASAQYKVYATWNGVPPQIPITAPDPRLVEAGYRSLANSTVETTATAADYNAHRLALGLPDGQPDLEPDKTLLLEAGFDELHGVAWDKGCYMGQELTARTKYRGLIKRRLIPVMLSEPAPPPGTPVLAEGVEVGTLRSAAGAVGLATLRLDALHKSLLAGNALVSPRFLPWMHLPA